MTDEVEDKLLKLIQELTSLNQKTTKNCDLLLQAYKLTSEQVISLEQRLDTLTADNCLL